MRSLQNSSTNSGDTVIAASACDAASGEETRRLFVDVVQKRIIASGRRPAPRPVFRKLHGVARGDLLIDANLPERFRHGIFAGRDYPAWIRFSSDTASETPDGAGSTLGIGIKLFHVTGTTLDEDDPDAGTADLLMQNHDRFFVATGRDFCDFSHAAVLGDFDAWLAGHPETAEVLAEMSKIERSVLGATYWSVLPYACGSEASVKYRLTPLGHQQGDAPRVDVPNFLRNDFISRLTAGPARFELAVQAFTSEAETPLDNAMIRWQTPFQRIGELVIGRQDVAAAGQDAYGDNLSIHPWRVPQTNMPLGSIAQSRRLAYRSAGALRRTINGVSTCEPCRPR